MTDDITTQGDGQNAGLALDKPTPPAETEKPAVPKTDVFLGIVLDFDGHHIALEPKSAITDIKNNGLECGLPDGQRVELGLVGERLKDIFELVGVQDTGAFLDEKGNFKTDVLPSGFPLVEKVVDLITGANLAIEAFHIKLPGALTTDKNKYYTVGLSATWTEDSGKLIEALDLSLRGIYFKVSNEGQAK